jgi:hypothetical protein
MIITLVFKEKGQFFAENWGKIAENCDHNIESWFGKYIQKDKKGFIIIVFNTFL